MSKKETYKFEILNKDNYHIYYEDRDDNAGGAIVYKNLKNNEFYEQFAKIENLTDFYNTCEMCIINFWHLLPFGKNQNDKNHLIFLTDIKSLRADLNKKDSSPENQAQSDKSTTHVIQREPATEESINAVDEYKLQAEHQAATAMVEVNMQQFEAERQEIKEQEQAEREELIAEASRLTGRVEAFSFISKLTTVGSLMTIKKIKESGAYKELPNCKTWQDYCKSIGFSANKIDEDLLNLNTFGENLLTTVGDFNLGYKDLRQLRKEVKSGQLEVKDESVVIDGEVIPLDDKDELRDALDTLLKSKYKEIEEKDKLLKEKEIQLEVVRETKDSFARRMDKAEEEAEKYKKEINVLNNNIEQLQKNKPSFKNVSEADSEDFNKLLTLESDWRDLFNSLKNATNDDNLSSFNKSMLGGIVAQILVMLDDFRMQLNGKSEFYFHGVNIDEEHLNNQISPSDYLAMQSEK